MAMGCFVWNWWHWAKRSIGYTVYRRGLICNVVGRNSKCIIQILNCKYSNREYHTEVKVTSYLYFSCQVAADFSRYLGLYRVTCTSSTRRRFTVHRRSTDYSQSHSGKMAHFDWKVKNMLFQPQSRRSSEAVWRKNHESPSDRNLALGHFEVENGMT